MTPVIEAAYLGSDLDCQDFNIRNLKSFIPIPENLVGIYDSRLEDGRMVPFGSVTDFHVDAVAAIDQSKLNLNLNIPSDWIISSIPGGDDEPRAAEGSQAEFHSNKGAPNGYASLDSNGQIAMAHLTPGDAIGSIGSVGLKLPDPFTVHPQSITTSGTFNVNWTAPANSWFGSDGTVDFQHHESIFPFIVTHPFNDDFIELPASKIVSGVFASNVFPVFKGVGPNHALGMVPDPGSSGDHNMYLGRDTNWYHFVVNDPALAHQPKIDDVTIVLDWWEAHVPTTADPSLVKAHITIRSLLHGAKLFYRVTSQTDVPSAFTEAHYDDTPDDAHVTIETNDFDTVEAYAARQGYINSDIEEWQVVTPISDLGL